MFTSISFTFFHILHGMVKRIVLSYELSCQICVSYFWFCSLVYVVCGVLELVQAQNVLQRILHLTGGHGIIMVLIDNNPFILFMLIFMYCIRNEWYDYIYIIQVFLVMCISNLICCNSSRLVDYICLYHCVSKLIIYVFCIFKL